MHTTLNTLQEELIAVSGKMYVGEPTAIVYDLLKDTDAMDALLSHLTGGVYNAGYNKPNTTVREEGRNRLSIEEWLGRCQEL